MAEFISNTNGVVSENGNIPLNGVPQVKIPEKKEPLVFNKVEKIYAAVIMILAFLFVEFEVFNKLGFFTTGANILIITASLIFLKKENCTLTAFNRVFAGVLYAFSFVFSITDNTFIKFLAAVFLFLAGAYFVYSAAEGRSSVERYLPFAMIKAVIEFPISRLDAELHAARSCAGDSKAASNIKYVIIGLIITIPVTAVVASLLISADAGMSKIFSNISMFVAAMNGFEKGFHLIFSVPCSLYLYSMLYTNCKRGKVSGVDPMRCEYTMLGLRLIPNVVLYTAVTPILILYVMFFISQGSYFLSAFFGTLPEGYSYSAYARRGFFELCGVTFINLLILIFISCFAKNGGKKKPLGLKIYSVSLSVSTLVLVAVAASKMVMYISKYGLTLLRWYVMWFMLLCAIVFVIFIVKQFRSEMNFSGKAAGAFTVMLAILCFAAPDRIIAMYNIDMYASGHLKELDKKMICRMSDDAVLYALEHNAISEKEAYYVAHIEDKTFYDRMNISSFILYEKVKDVELTETDIHNFNVDYR